MPLTGIKVLELEGIGPGPLAACILADFGADVITVSRVAKGAIASQNWPVGRGKRSIAIDLKSPVGLETFKELASKADVVIEPFRSGHCHLTLRFRLTVSLSLSLCCSHYCLTIAIVVLLSLLLLHPTMPR